MKRFILLLSLMCFVFGMQAQNKSKARRGTYVKRAAITKRTSTPKVHKITPMTRDQISEYTKHMVDSIQMDGTNWESIIKLPGLTKTDIYRFAKEYMSKAFTNWAKNVQIDDSENGKIVCIAVMQTIATKRISSMDGNSCVEVFNGNTKQTLTLDIKDERVRVRGEGFTWTGKATLYIGNTSCDPSYYYGEGMLTMSMLIEDKDHLVEGKAKFCEVLRLGALQYLTELRNYALKAKLDDDF